MFALLVGLAFGDSLRTFVDLSREALTAPPREPINVNQLLLRRIPRLLQETELRRMGAELARGLAERSVVRLVRDVLVGPGRRGQPA